MKINYSDHFCFKNHYSSITFMAFILLFSLGSLFLPSTAFLEAGVSSYLENAMSHMPEAGWNLVKPWATEKRKGFFAGDAAGGKIYQDRFVTPEQGIYFIALNLQLTNVTTGILKASLVINDEFEKKNGFEGFVGKTTSTETVSMSGFLLLYENDVIACYLSGSAGILLSDSTFSVMKMSRIGSVPGFHAVLSRDQVIEPHTTSRLNYWRTSGSKGLFVMQSGTSPSVGLYCSIVDGIHKFTSNINLESKTQSTSVDVSIVLNSNTTLVKRYSSGTNRYSTSVSGMFNLTRGDCVEMRIECTDEGLPVVLTGTSFSGLFLDRQMETNRQFSASLPSHNQLQMSPGWNKVQNWIVNYSKRNFPSLQTILKNNHSKFMPDTSGVFIVVAVMNINASTESQSDLRLLVSVTEPSSGNSGLLAAYSFSSSLRSLIVSGLVSLNKGDSLSVYVYGDSRESDMVDGLFCVSAVPYDWPGVAASLTEAIPLNFPEWTKITEWKTNGVPGLFSFDNAFFPTKGVYRPHQDGSYFVSCNVIFAGEGKGYLSAIIAIDDSLDPRNGLYALDENPKRLVTLNVAGSIELRKGQNVSVYVKTTASSSWNVSIETGFSVVLIGADSLATPGILAVKQEEASEIFTGGEIGEWKLIQQVSDPFFLRNSRFDSATGRFKAKEDGLYLISAIMLILHSGLSQIRMAFVADGQSINVTTFQSNSLNSKSGAFVSTLTLSSTVHLYPNQKVSTFIDLLGQNSFSCKVLPNSSFSAVLVSRWESDYTAGFLATAIYDAFGQTGYKKVADWKSVPSVSKKYKITPSTSINIKNSGLYFLQSVLIIVDYEGDKAFDSGVCIDGIIAHNGISASKLSDVQKSGKFVISAFGVIFLRKGQNISPCIKSKKRSPFATIKDSWFSIVRFLPRRQTPGFHQILEDGNNKKVFPGCSVTGFMSRGGGQLAYINGDIYKPNPTSPNDKGNFTAPVKGTYLISLLFTLIGNLTANVTACVGSQKSAGCLVKIYDTWRKRNYTFGFVGLIDLEKNEIISVCLQPKTEISSLIGVTISVEFRGQANTTVQLKHISDWSSSTGWQELTQWRTRGGYSVDKLYVMESGLYILSINLQIKAGERSLFGVKFDARGLSNRSVLSVLAHSEGDAIVSYSAAVVARLNESETMAASVYSDSQSLLVTNTTMFAALVTSNDKYSCLTLRSKTSYYISGTWWKAIGDWENFDEKCKSSNSDFIKGIFVAELPGIYFLATTVVVKTSHLSNQTRIMELLLTVNGDAMNTNGLKATKSVTDGLSVILSLSATAYLEQWQTLYLMIRSSGEGDFEVTNGGTFSVVLLEETRQYKTIGNNIIQFDKGPRIIRHPPAYTSLGGDLGLNVSWRCDAVAEGNVSYQWLKNNQPFAPSHDLSLINVQVSHTGQYVCLAEYDGIKVYSTQADLDVFDTTPQFETREFNATENKNASFELPFSALDKERMAAIVSLVIVKGNTKGTFVLFPEVAQDRFSLRNQIPLDHEAINLFHLTLKATNQDTKKSTEVEVTIHILDDNDNKPIFHNRTVNISVEENVANGTFIYQVKAIDKDSGNNSRIKYTLLSGEYKENFVIDASSGNVSVNGNLDRESRGDFTLLIQATDGKFRSNMSLLITILDVNEFQPVFNPQYYKKNISEMASFGTPIIRVSATDEDSAENSIIHYKIISGNINGTFGISETNGTILLQKSLDYETLSGYELLVEVSDGKYNSTANVSIQVEDFNDNSPYFTKNLFSTTISDDIPIGFVVMNLTALDSDSGCNGYVTYSLAENLRENDHLHLFHVIPTSGAIITLDKLKLNAPLVKYRFSVIASDHGIPSRQSRVNVTIIVEDANNSPPVFTDCPDIIVIGSTKPEQHFFNVSASDADYGSNANIGYFIDDGPSSEMCSSNSNMFQVDEKGAVRNVQELEEKCIYNITICATDGVKFDRCTVTLRVNLPDEPTSVERTDDPQGTQIIVLSIIGVLLSGFILGLIIICCFRRRRISVYAMAKKDRNKAESEL